MLHHRYLSELTLNTAAWYSIHEYKSEGLRLISDNLLMILVLEDDPERCKHFSRNWGNHLIQFTDQAEEAKHLMQTFKFDLLFLDHDLGGEVYVDSDHKNTGAEVARWLEDPLNHHCRPYVIVIHTLNPIGRRYMAQALPSAVVCDDGAWLYPPHELEKHVHPAKRYTR